MNEAQAAFTDEELTAYLDGEADAALRSRVELALTSDAALAQRLQTLDLPVAALRDVFSTAALGAPQMPDGLIPASRPARAPLRLVAGLAMAFGLGVLSTYMLHPGPQPQKAPGWKAVVASYQSLYITDTVVNAGQPTEVTAEVLDGFSSGHGVDLSPAQTVEGLEFKRAQLLGFKGKPLLQMAYLDPDGVPVAFCIIRSSGADKAMQSEVLAGMAAASWVSDGIGYLVIGGQDQSFVDGVAADLQGKLG